MSQEKTIMEKILRPIDRQLKSSSRGPTRLRRSDSNRFITFNHAGVGRLQDATRLLLHGSTTLRSSPTLSQPCSSFLFFSPSIMADPASIDDRDLGTCNHLDDDDDDDDDIVDEFAEFFRCCVCLDFLYKPIVLGKKFSDFSIHVDAAIFLVSAMSGSRHSRCPICRNPYSHFPSICQLLHFLLLKIDPVAYRRREAQLCLLRAPLGIEMAKKKLDSRIHNWLLKPGYFVGCNASILCLSTEERSFIIINELDKEENKSQCFSPQFDDNLTTKWTHTTNKPDVLSCSPSSSINVFSPRETFSETCLPEETNSCGTVQPLDCNSHCHGNITAIPENIYPENTDQKISSKENNLSESGPEKRLCKTIILADVLCISCKQMLFRPTVLNCGHGEASAYLLVVNLKQKLVSDPGISAHSTLYRSKVYWGLKADDSQDLLLAKSFGTPMLTLHILGLKKVTTRGTAKLGHWLMGSEKCGLLELWVCPSGCIPLEYLQSKIMFPVSTICMWKIELFPFPPFLTFAYLNESTIADPNKTAVRRNDMKISLQMYPIIGKRYRCKDCVETMGFDLCEECYETQSKLPGRFNQRHTPDHKFELIRPSPLPNLVVRLVTEQSDDGSGGSVLSDDAPDDIETDLSI
ncbi:hypothetical protein ACLOJK_011314 [Asimina triloba]